MESGTDVMSFEEFVKVIAEVTRVDVEKITPDASFLDDLYVDSIRMLEMLVTIEDQGLTISPEQAWRIRTVGDAYDYYLNHRPDA